MSKKRIVESFKSTNKSSVRKAIESEKKNKSPISEKRLKYTVSLPPSLHKRLKVYAVTNDTTISSIIEGSMRQFLKDNDS